MVKIDILVVLPSEFMGVPDGFTINFSMGFPMASGTCSHHVHAHLGMGQNLGKPWNFPHK